MTASDHEQARSTASRARDIRWLIGVILCFVPMIALAVSPWHEATVFAFVGLMPTLLVVPLGWRTAAVATVSVTGVVLVGSLLASLPWAAVVFMIAVCLGVVIAQSRGWGASATYIATQGAMTVVIDPATRLAGTVPVGVEALAAAGVVFVGSLWVMLVGLILLRDVPLPKPPTPTPKELRRYGILLFLVVAPITFVAVTWFSGTDVWWVLLTVFVILQPDPAKTRTRLLERVLGTVVGGAVAAVLAVLIHAQPAVTAIGSLLAIASAVAYLKAPYWVYASTLTAAVVFLSFTPATALIGDAERIGFTLIAAVAVAAVSLLSEQVARPRADRSQP